MVGEKPVLLGRTGTDRNWLGDEIREEKKCEKADKTMSGRGMG